VRSLAKITSRLVGIEFKHCSANMNEGMDCFRLCIEYLRMKGAVISEDTKYNGQAIFKYKTIYKKDAFKTMELAADYLSSIMQEVKVGYEVAGDILVMEMKKRELPIQLGIEAGNEHVVIAVLNSNVRVISKRLFYIDKVLRWV
jgi:hypothetical protein